MKEALDNWLFHAAAVFGSAVYVLMKPDKKWSRNLIKFAIGYVCSMFSAPLFLSVFQYFFGFSQETFNYHLTAAGFIVGVLGMTLYETLSNWISRDVRPLLSKIVESWLKKKE